MKYCRQCLTNRYGESPNGTYNTSGGEPGATGSRDKTYKCPRCRDICNCWRCRRAKGLGPTGNMKTTTGRTTNNALITPFTTPGTKKVSPVSLRDTGESFAGTPNRKSLSIDIIRDPAPSPQWTRAANKFTFEDGAARFTIREFILRFSSAMEPNISNTHLNEIDHIFGSWNTNDHETLPAWISEACVKSIITSLLGLIGSDSEDNIVETKYIKDAAKQLRVAGDNLSKIWTILSSLQNNAAGSCSTRVSQSLGNLPRPSPPPESCQRRTTRSISQTSIQILHSIQFMPIISALVIWPLKLSLFEKHSKVAPGKKRN
ncbi:hypothetical protein BD779DRAFT_977508 [Infundibulicybe gibba]|nr:hypothetical protein BD779DRAFT_977508 [Infundibulicybe gibba]